MTTTDLARLAGLVAQKGRFAAALNEFRRGEQGANIQEILLPEEFMEIRQAANLAAENALDARLRGVSAQVENFEI